MQSSSVVNSDDEFQSSASVLVRTQEECKQLADTGDKDIVLYVNSKLDDFIKKLDSIENVHMNSLENVKVAREKEKIVLGSETSNICIISTLCCVM